MPQPSNQAWGFCPASPAPKAGSHPKPGQFLIGKYPHFRFPAPAAERPPRKPPQWQQQWCKEAGAFAARSVCQPAKGPPARQGRSKNRPAGKQFPKKPNSPANCHWRQEALRSHGKLTKMPYSGVNILRITGRHLEKSRRLYTPMPPPKDGLPVLTPRFAPVPPPSGQGIAMWSSYVSTSLFMPKSYHTRKKFFVEGGFPGKIVAGMVNALYNKQKRKGEKEWLRNWNGNLPPRKRHFLP